LTNEQRIAPFLALLEARYLPLLLAVAHQAYTMHLWLWHGSDQSYAALFFSIIGALGYESIYVGAIAWTVEGRTSPWTWITSAAALVFSVAVAVYVYWASQGYAALLHAGFPIVGFCYTMALHHMQTQAIAIVAPVETPAEQPIEAPAPLPTPEPEPMPLPAGPDIDFTEVPADSSQEEEEESRPVSFGLPDWLEGMEIEVDEEIARIRAEEHEQVQNQQGEDHSTLPLSKRVVAILNKRPHLTDAELYALLPGHNQKSIRVYSSGWRKEHLATASPNGNGRH
jgi:hypothetical protein